MFATSLPAAAVALVVCVGCGGGRADTSAVDLAPSQITASTVAPPDTPLPCDPALLTFDAAPGADAATLAVITITNGAGERCEVDVFDSPSVDPLMEPDAWLEAGAAAELLVAEGAVDCVAPSAVAELALVVNERSIAVAIESVMACRPTLVAIYPL